MPKLKRALGFWELVLTGIGIILGAGIYVIIGPAAGLAGNALWLSFVIAAIVSSFTGLSYAELSSRFPHAGAEYVYTKEAFNKKLAFIVSWLMIISCIIASATVALGFSWYFNALFGTNIILTSLLLIFVMSMLSLYGIKESAWFAIICTIIEAGGLIIIIFLGLPYLGSVNYFEAPQGIGGILAAASLVFFAFIGFEDMVNTAEEVKNPVKNMPRAVILAVGVTAIMYILVAISAISVLGWEGLSGSHAPLAAVAQRAFGEGSFTALGTIALFATANTVLLIMLGISRLIYGMAERGMLPKVLSKVHKERRTPWVAILLVMAVSMVFVLIGNIQTVASLTNASILIVFLAINASVIMVRHKENAKGKVETGIFRMPLNIGWFPVIPLLGFLSCLFLLLNIELNLIIICLLLVIPGLMLYSMLERVRRK
jgi:APA family basic amino acid/polyamine antiporter